MFKSKRSAQAAAQGATTQSRPQPLVVLKHISKHFRRGVERIDVLDGLDLEISRGDFVALMAPSGSGKSTLLNIIGGIERPSKGEIVVEGKSLQKMSESAIAKWRAHNIGFVFQLYHLLPGLTAEQNVELPLILTKLNARERRRRAHAALTATGIEDRASHKPSQLSGGQQQRVAIARAIVSDPKILLCDEPTGDLDRKAGGEILKLLKLVNSEYGKTILMVTHDPHAAAHAKRTLFLDGGVLKEEPGELT